MEIKENLLKIIFLEKMSAGREVYSVSQHTWFRNGAQKLEINKRVEKKIGIVSHLHHVTKGGSSGVDI